LVSLQGFGLFPFLLPLALLFVPQQTAQIDVTDGLRGSLKTSMELDLAADLVS
jgi:hypothetical protein